MTCRRPAPQVGRPSVDDGEREALAGLGAELVASAGDANGANLLIAHPAEVSAQGLTDALEGAKCAPSRYIEIGCHARRFRLGSGS